MIFFVFIITILTVGRVSRFITTDELIAEPRRKLMEWLWNFGRPDDVHAQAWEGSKGWRRKLFKLIECPWCVSIYVSAGAIGLLYLFTDYSIPIPVFWWPALSLGSVVLLDPIDGAKNVVVQLNPKK